MFVKRVCLALVTLCGLGAMLSAEDFFQFDGNTGMQFYKEGTNLTGMKGSSDFADFTFEAWIKPDHLNSDMYIIDGESNWSISNFILRADGSLSFGANYLPYGSNHWHEIRSVASVVTTGIWNHVAVSYDNANTPRRMNLYVNGVAVGIVDDKDVLDTKTSMWNRQVTFIGQNDGGGGKFEGQMRDVRLWGVVKTESEILAAKDSTLVGDEAGLVAWVPMNDKIGGDVTTLGSNSGLKTKVLGSPIWGGDSAPASNNAYLGNGNYITVADPDGLLNFNYNGTTKAMTVCTWLQTSATAGTIFSRVTTPGNNQAGYSAKLRSDGLVDIVFYGWGSSDELITTIPINDGLWHHFAVVLNGQQLSIYVDGVLDTQFSDQDYDDGVSNTKPLTIGANEDGSNAINASFSDFRIYQDDTVGNSAIAQSDIQTIMADTSNAHTITNVEQVVQLPLASDLNNTVSNTITGGTGTVEYMDHFVSALPAVGNLTVSNLSGAGFDLSWDAVTGATGYQVDISKNSGYTFYLSGYQAFETTSTTISVPTTVMGDLYVRVRAVSGAGVGVYALTTLTKTNAESSDTDYILPTAWNYDNRWRITKVTTSGAADNLNNSANNYNGWHIDYTDLHTVKAHSGSTFDLTVGLPDNWCGGKVWIDWDNNGIFDDSSSEYVGELGILDGVNGTGPEVTITVTVPDSATLTALPLNTRMRIMVSDIGGLDSGNFDPMGTDASFISNKGQAQDYAVTIVPGTYFVDADKATSGDGATWATAVKTIAEGITLATPDAAKVFVKTATSDYSVSSNIAIPANVKVYGGFVGSETSTTERGKVSGGHGWEFSAPTVLDGTGFSANRMVTMAAGSVLDGFTVQAGQDGGIQVDGTGAVINSCIIKDTTRVADSNRGCAITINQGLGKTVISNSWIHNNVFSGKTGSYPNHSGTAVGSGVNDGSPFDVINCMITNNKSEVSPVLWCRTDYVNVINSVIAYNEKTDAGDSRGIISDNHSGANSTTYVNCTIVKNSAPNKTDLKLFHTSTAKNCIIWSNGPHGIGQMTLVNNNGIDDATSAATGTDNIDLSSTDPAFEDVVVTDIGYQETYQASDWRLAAGSTLLGMGDNGSVPAGTTTDITGTIARVIGSDVEAGAYESEILDPVSPTGVVVEKQGDDTLKATWSLTVGEAITGFKWELATDENFSTVVDNGTIVNPTATEVTSTVTLSESSFYYFRVCSYVVDTNEAWVNADKLMNYIAGTFATFDGTGVLSVTGLDGLFNTELTISFWAKAAVDLGQNWLFSGTSTTNTDLRISAHVPWTDNNVYYDAGGTATANRASNAINVDQHVWNHYAMVTEADGTAIIYINGELLATVDHTPYAPTFNMDTFTFGGKGIGDQPYKGDIDSFRVWSVARTQSEIQALMFSEPVATRATTGLEMNFTFDDTLSDGFATNSATDDNSLEAQVLGSVTPAIGLEVIQDGTTLTWSVSEEIGVKEYQIVDVATGEVIAIVTAGQNSYTYELDSDVAVKLVVVDESGFKQAFYPENGNEIVVQYDLVKGWNMIAAPGENADLSALNSELWGWNGTAYEIVTTLAVGEAAWVYAPAAKSVTVTAGKAEPKLILNQGWNMTGPTENMIVPEEAIMIYSWNETYKQLTEKDETLIRGIGYWIFCF